MQATIATGRITGVDTSAADAEPGVLAVLTHRNAPRLALADDPELAVLQTDEIAFRGQLVGGVVAETPEIARHAARLVRLDCAERAHDVELRSDRDDLYKPLNAAFFGRGGGELMDGSPADSALGDATAALASADIRLDATYSTPMVHHNPMEPHTAVVDWTDDGLTLYCSTQSVTMSRDLMAAVLGLDPRRVRVISPHVGGAFGSKVYPHAYGRHRRHRRGHRQRRAPRDRHPRPGPADHPGQAAGRDLVLWPARFAGQLAASGAGGAPTPLRQWGNIARRSIARVLDVLGRCDNAARCRAGRREPVNLSGRSTRGPPGSGRPRRRRAGTGRLRGVRARPNPGRSRATSRPDRRSAGPDVRGAGSTG
ncbi:xanthine dehydrogenase family protein molybdopterin-binding subunit [Streptomyces sp. NPDC002573]|uniref:xanthine dehydrogenase family protein molybdopterin-binding subunit n=1 Tax=Streptomyces sp. NPDC002573 TaxID=3364651 RepID=UPI003691A1ED